MNLKHLTDERLISETKKIVNQEREILVQVLHHLKEIERRRLFSELGCTSLFAYVVKQLGYSEDQAHRRISAMRLLRDLPELEERVQDGKITLTNLSMAQSLFRREERTMPLKKEQKIELMEALENKTSREAEKIVAQRFSLPAAFGNEKMSAVSEDLTEVKFVITEELRLKIETLKGLLAHKNSNISLSELINKLCDLGIESWDPSVKARNKKFKASSDSLGAPQVTSIQQPKSISAEVKSQIWLRAKSKCENCSSKYALQVDHIKPRALCGSNDIENLRLLCRNCNQRAATQTFGVSQMQKHLVSSRKVKASNYSKDFESTSSTSSKVATSRFKNAAMGSFCAVDAKASEPDSLCAAKASSDSESESKLEAESVSKGDSPSAPCVTP
jgi:hypothetical protein